MAFSPAASKKSQKPKIPRVNLLKSAVFKRPETMTSPGLNLSNQIISSSKMDSSSSSSSEDEDENTLPTHQAILLISIKNACGKNSVSSVKLDQVKVFYKNSCELTMLKQQGDSDLMSMLNCLVDRAYVRIEGKVPYNTASLNKCKVGLCVEEQDIKRAFQDKTLLSKLI